MDAIVTELDQGAPPREAEPHKAEPPNDAKAQDEVLMEVWYKVEQERQIQRLSAAHYGAWHFWFLFMPSALLTLLAGILAFLSTSDMLGSALRVRLSIVVGCLALVATFLQALSDQLKLDSRAAMHRSAVLDLKRICDDLEFMSIVPS